jgi:hypothetical protein
MQRRTTTALVAALSLVLAACGGGDKKEAKRTTTTAKPSTTSTPPTTAPPVPAGHYPLTALPGDPARVGRPLLMVKIDNAPKARPQAGLAQADVVYEELVEGGVTRFAVLFHSQDAPDLGPVRSARSTDMHLAQPLNRPLFAYSGANAVFDQLIAASPVVNVGYEAFPGDYERRRGRPAPYNVFTASGRLHAKAPPGSGPPPPMFYFRAAGAPSPVGDPVRGVGMEYRANIVTRVNWGWDGTTQVWNRLTEGRPHLDAAGANVAARNVIVQFVNYHDTGLRDRSGTMVPEAELVGEGEAWVFTDGKVVKGKWRRPTPEAVTQYVDAAGTPIRLTPGTTWVELPRPGTATIL